MFGWFRPKCPLDWREKTWTELRFQWLVDRLGAEAVRQVDVVVPDDSRLPHDYSGRRDEIEDLFDQACDWMRVPRSSVELRFFEGQIPGDAASNAVVGTAGMFMRSDSPGEPDVVWIDIGHVREPVRLLATLAHELAHSTLLHQGWISSGDLDAEFVTDLVPVVRGLGVFAANATLSEQSSFAGGLSKWQMSKLGYLPARIHGYALALLCLLKDDLDPSWRRHLRGDANHSLIEALRYVRKTGDCLCTFYSGRSSVVWESSLVARLNSSVSGLFLAALWELRRPDTGKIPDDVWGALIAGLSRKDRLIVAETAMTISTLRRSDPEVVEQCVELLRRFPGDSEVESSIAHALGSQSHGAQQIIEELSRLLERESRSVVLASLAGLKNFGPAAREAAFNGIVKSLRAGLRKQDQTMIAQGVATLRAVCDDPERILADQFRDDDEHRRLVFDESAAILPEHAVLETRLPTSTSLPIPLPFG